MIFGAMRARPSIKIVTIACQPYRPAQPLQQEVNGNGVQRQAKVLMIIISNIVTHTACGSISNDKYEHKQSKKHSHGIPSDNYIQRMIFIR
jgi:hypothetical protein